MENNKAKAALIVIFAVLASTVIIYGGIRWLVGVSTVIFAVKGTKVIIISIFTTGLVMFLSMIIAFAIREFRPVLSRKGKRQR